MMPRLKYIPDRAAIKPVTLTKKIIEQALLLDNITASVGAMIVGNKKFFANSLQSQSFEVLIQHIRDKSTESLITADISLGGWITNLHRGDI